MKKNAIYSVSNVRTGEYHWNEQVMDNRQKDLSIQHIVELVGCCEGQNECDPQKSWTNSQKLIFVMLVPTDYEILLLAITWDPK